MSLTELNIRSGIVSSNVGTVLPTEGACLKQVIADQTGRSFSLGATVFADGVNFSVFSRQAGRVELLLFDHADAALPTRLIELDARRHRTYHYWHTFVPGIRPGQIYAYRASGPFLPEHGLRFDPDKVLLDPYGRAVVVPDAYSRHVASQRGENNATAMKSVVVDPDQYDWEGDAPLQRSFAKTVIYEMHVAGFTRHPSSGVTAELRGTYAGMIEKIPYLRDLGITAVELLPVFQFDRQDCPPGLVNYWGYSPVSFFAPHAGYSSRKDVLGPVDEFRDLVKALHRSGIEVILDVVYNHTAEGNAAGPTLCFKGLANEIYYILDKDRAQYADYSGTGNTLNANQPVVRRMIIDSLRYWVVKMHVDGFRFDLASILARDETGRPLENPPVLWDIETNGEGNRDGSDNNLSWNCGVEGLTDDAEVERLRRRQIKNFIVILLMSVGTPMLQMGDEVRRSQRGNNNAYCQDNEVIWLDWSLLERHQDLYRFVQRLIAHRLRAFGWSGEERLALSLNELLRQARIDWHGIRLGSPDWADDSHSIAFTIRSSPLHLPVWLHLTFNAYWEALDFELPSPPAAIIAGWRRWLDTSLESPDDITDPYTAPLVPGPRYRVAPRSVTALFLRIDSGHGSSEPAPLRL